MSGRRPGSITGVKARTPPQPGCTLCAPGSPMPAGLRRPPPFCQRLHLMQAPNSSGVVWQTLTLSSTTQRWPATTHPRDSRAPAHLYPAPPPAGEKRMLSVAGENMMSLKGDIPAVSGLLSWEGDMRIGVMPGDRPAGQFAGGGVGVKQLPVGGWVRVESNAQDLAGGS